MPAQIVERAFGGGENFDIERLEQSAGPEFRSLQRVGDDVVMAVGIGCAEALPKPEQGLERMIEPKAGRRAARTDR